MKYSVLATLGAVLMLGGCAVLPGTDSPEEARSIAAQTDQSLAWSFQNMDQQFPVALVARGDGTVDALGVNLQNLSGVSFTNVAGEQATLADYLSGAAVDAMVVTHDGEIVYERYANGQTADTRHIVYSVTKSFTALVAELLIHEGVLDENVPLSTYVPELEGSAYGDATLRQALNMQIGSDFSEVYDDPNSSIAQFAYAAGVVPRPEGMSGPETLHDFLPTVAKSGEHGGPFHYNTATTEVVGWVIERASGSTVPVLLSERIFSKIGAEHDANMLAADANGTAMSGGGLSITARDLVRLGHLVMNDGVGPGDDVVIPAAIIEAIRAADLSLDDWSVPGGTATYRSFWYVNGPDRVTVAMGIHGQVLYVSPDKRVVAAMQSSNEAATGDYFVDAELMFNAMAGHLGD